MQTLEYQNPYLVPRTSLAVCALTILPILAAGLVGLGVIVTIGEPLFVVTALDHTIVFGAPPLVIVAWTAWCRIARRRRLVWPAIVGVSLWFVLMLYTTIDILGFYLWEPWNS
jgi:hypothetical protein